MGSAPVGAQYPLTSSLGEFLGYWDWLWYPGLSPVLVSIIENTEIWKAKGRAMDTNTGESPGYQSQSQ